jgi:hypothetical protein
MSELKENWPFKNKCDEIGEFLYCQYKKEDAPAGGEDREGCGDLMLEWIKSTFWGLVVRDHLKIFEKTWQLLNDGKHIGKSNAFRYGDADVDVWIEKVKNPQDKKVIASIRYCSMADDNTHLFIMTGLKLYPQYPEFIKFLCRTVWPQEKKGNYEWGDDRSIEIPSIETYRKRDFEFSYRDARDKGHVFTYNQMFSNRPELDKPHWHENRISHGLRTLRWHLEVLEAQKNMNRRK